MTLEHEEPRHFESLEDFLVQIHELKGSLQDHISISSTPNRACSEEDIKFSRNEHISIKQPTKKLTFSDLSLPLPASASSETAATEPFPLFTPSSIPLLRKALLNESYITKTGTIFGPKTLIVRNTAAHSPFFRRMMTDPLVLRELSKAAGVELEPVLETMELGHANVQVNFAAYENITDEEEKLKAVARDLTKGRFAETPLCGKETRIRPEEEIENNLQHALLPWHLDSYPWVCVAMISDTTDMVGGETVLQTGNGGYQAIAQPGAGSAMMLQGGLIKHLALPCSGATDRITLVTSFRPRSPLFYDSCFMSNIRPYSDLPQLYLQWIECRLARLVPGINRLNNKRRFNAIVDNLDCEEELEEGIVLREYAKRTLRQMVPPLLVHNLVERFSRDIFYSIRDDYVSGKLFNGPAKPCKRCDVKGAKVTKAHMAECAGGFNWRPGSPLWTDAWDTQRALNSHSLEVTKICEELQVKDVIHAWAEERRPWGVADELAVQGLNEYLLEFLEFFGVV